MDLISLCDLYMSWRQFRKHFGQCKHDWMCTYVVAITLNDVTGSPHRVLFCDTPCTNTYTHVQTELMSMLNHLWTLLWLRRIIFSRAMCCLNSHLGRFLAKCSIYQDVLNCYVLNCLLTPLFTLFVTFSLCKYRKMVLYMLPALFPFHIYELEKKLERKYWMSEH